MTPIAGGRGFPTHPHAHGNRPYVLDGELAHKDQHGQRFVIKPGDVQYMSAARASRTASSRFGQSSVHMNNLDVSRQTANSGYDQKHFSAVEAGTAAPGGSPTAATVREVREHELYATVLAPGET